MTQACSATEAVRRRKSGKIFKSCMEVHRTRLIQMEIQIITAPHYLPCQKNHHPQFHHRYVQFDNCWNTSFCESRFLTGILTCKFRAWQLLYWIATQTYQRLELLSAGPEPVNHWPNPNYLNCPKPVNTCQSVGAHCRHLFPNHMYVKYVVPDSLGKQRHNL